MCIKNFTFVIKYANAAKAECTSYEEVDKKLQDIMSNIHEACVSFGKEGDFTNYVKGANIAGFIKVADAMMDQGVV